MAEACPAYPWQHCSRTGRIAGTRCSCRGAATVRPATRACSGSRRWRGELPGVLQAAEFVFAVADEAQPAAVATARSPRGAVYTPDLAALATKIEEGRVYNNVYFSGGAITASMPRMLAEGVLACQELKKKMAL